MGRFALPEVDFSEEGFSFSIFCHLEWRLRKMVVEGLRSRCSWLLFRSDYRIFGPSMIYNDCDYLLLLFGSIMIAFVCRYVWIYYLDRVFSFFLTKYDCDGTLRVS